LAENEERSPWEPFHVQHGFTPVVGLIRWLQEMIDGTLANFPTVFIPLLDRLPKMVPDIDP
jgi:hypothetical protein